MANRDVRLAIWTNPGFTGRRVLFRRGGVAITNMQAIRLDQDLSSFRLQNLVARGSVTLLLFSRNNFQGSFRVFRGSQNVSDLGSFNNKTESLILVGRLLTDAQVQTIRNTGKPPLDVLVISQ